MKKSTKLKNERKELSSLELIDLDNQVLQKIERLINILLEGMTFHLQINHDLKSILTNKKISKVKKSKNKPKNSKKTKSPKVKS